MSFANDCANRTEFEFFGQGNILFSMNPRKERAFHRAARATRPHQMTGMVFLIDDEPIGDLVDLLNMMGFDWRARTLEQVRIEP